MGSPWRGPDIVKCLTSLNFAAIVSRMPVALCISCAFMRAYFLSRVQNTGDILLIGNQACFRYSSVRTKVIRTTQPLKNLPHAFSGPGRYGLIKCWPKVIFRSAKTVELRTLLRAWGIPTQSPSQPSAKRKTSIPPRRWAHHISVGGGLSFARLYRQLDLINGMLKLGWSYSRFNAFSRDLRKWAAYISREAVSLEDPGRFLEQQGDRYYYWGYGKGGISEMNSVPVNKIWKGADSEQNVFLSRPWRRNTFWI